MGDETDRLAGLSPQFQKLFVQMITDDLVQRAERLVHQQQIGIESQRAGDGGTLLHAAGQLPREFPPEPVEPDEVQRTRHTLGFFYRAQPHDFQRQPNIALDCPPGQQGRRLKDIAIGAFKPRLLGRHAVDGDRSRRRMFEIGNHPQQRGLAATRRPDEGYEITFLDAEIDILQGVDRPVIRIECQAQFLGIDDHVFASLACHQTPAGILAGSRTTARGAVSAFHFDSALLGAANGSRGTNWPWPSRVFTSSSWMAT